MWNQAGSAGTPYVSRWENNFYTFLPHRPEMVHGVRVNKHWPYFSFYRDSVYLFRFRPTNYSQKIVKMVSFLAFCRDFRDYCASEFVCSHQLRRIRRGRVPPKNRP